jgi:hypothetical protein
MIHQIFILREKRHLDATLAFLANNWESMMAKAGKPLVMEITEEKSKRSLSQNRLYFGRLLKQIENQAWIDGRQYSAETWHEYFRRKYIGLIDLPKGGTVGQSSTTLSVAEFKTYMDQVEAYAATELGVQFTVREP